MATGKHLSLREVRRGRTFAVLTVLAMLAGLLAVAPSAGAGIDLIDDFESGLPSGADGDGVPIGFSTWVDGIGAVAISTTATPPAPVPDSSPGNNVLLLDIDSATSAGFIHAFENAAVDTWVTQDWSAYERITFWLYGQNTGTSLFIDLLDNRNPSSTSDDAERWTVTFADNFSGWQEFKVPFSNFIRKEIGNGAPNDGLGLTEMHGWGFGTLNTSGPQTYYLDAVSLFAFDPCETHCDCEQFSFCYKGRCIRDANYDVYCCTKPGCPPGAWCINEEGAKDTCAEDPTHWCDSPCDCGPAHCCKDNKCVKDVGDPWVPGGIEVGPSCVQGVDATYCADASECFTGWYVYNRDGLLDDFRCFDNYTDSIRTFCGGQECFFNGDCNGYDNCADMRTAYVGEVIPFVLQSPEGGACVGGATLEAVFGYPSSALITACNPEYPGRACTAGWRPGNVYAIEQVVGLSGSCGNGVCEFNLLETSANCPTDCQCGDGKCDTSEVGTCADDCGVCDDSGCNEQVMPPEWSTLSVCGDGVCQKTGAIPEDCINCWLDCDAATDTDGDETPDGCDNCPTDSNPDQADFDIDGLGDVCDLDVDGDAVFNDDDVCPDTVLPDSEPPRWKKNRYMANAAGEFIDPRDRLAGPTVAETGGCSAEQIIDAAGLGIAHEWFGITKSALIGWSETINN